MLTQVSMVATPKLQIISLFLQALSNTVWGFSKLEVVHERLLDAVAAIALRKLNLFNGQNIANTVGTPASLSCCFCSVCVAITIAAYATLPLL